MNIFDGSNNPLYWEGVRLKVYVYFIRKELLFKNYNHVDRISPSQHNTYRGGVFFGGEDGERATRVCGDLGGVFF